MDVKQEIKNFSAYKDQVRKVIVFLSENKPNLDKYLLVKPYKHLIKLGHEYTDNSNSVLHAYCYSEDPNWSSSYENGVNSIGDITGNSKAPCFFKMNTHKVIINCGGMEYNGSEEFLINSDDLNHKYVYINAGGYIGSFDIINSLIAYAKVLIKVLDVNIKKDNKAIEARHSKEMSYKNTENNKLNKIKNGAYSWDKVFAN